MPWIGLCEGSCGIPIKQEAIDTYGNLHGWTIYNGCCQMDIKWGLSQERNTNQYMSSYATATDTNAILCVTNIGLLTSDHVFDVGCRC